MSRSREDRYRHALEMISRTAHAPHTSVFFGDAARAAWLETALASAINIALVALNDADVAFSNSAHKAEHCTLASARGGESEN